MGWKGIVQTRVKYQLSKIRTKTLQRNGSGWPKEGPHRVCAAHCHELMKSDIWVGRPTINGRAVIGTTVSVIFELCPPSVLSPELLGLSP